MPPPATNAAPPRTTFAASTPFVVATTPFAATASGAVVPAPGSAFGATLPDSRHRHGTTTVVGASPGVVVVPQVVYYPVVTAAAPTQCVTQGYWSYAWIPYTTMQNVWVDGSWGADGAWVDSHWEMRPYSSGYYEPYWTPGQSYAC